MRRRISNDTREKRWFQEHDVYLFRVLRVLCPPADGLEQCAFGHTRWQHSLLNISVEIHVREWKLLMELGDVKYVCGREDAGIYIVMTGAPAKSPRVSPTMQLGILIVRVS